MPRLKPLVTGTEGKRHEDIPHLLLLCTEGSTVTRVQHRVRIVAPGAVVISVEFM